MVNILNYKYVKIIICRYYKTIQLDDSNKTPLDYVFFLYTYDKIKSKLLMNSIKIYFQKILKIIPTFPKINNHSFLKCWIDEGIVIDGSWTSS